MPGNYKPPYTFSTHIGTAWCQQSRTFTDLAEKLKMNVMDLMRQFNGQVPPSKALVKGLARELDIDERYLEKLAEEGLGVARARLSSSLSTPKGINLTISCPSRQAPGG
jgi:transcriptional regulator with XRE-family HTH domain